MAYDDYQGNEYDGGNDWVAPVERKSAWSIDPPPAPEYQSQRFTPAQPVQPKAFKSAAPAAPGGAAPTPGGVLDSLSKAFKAAAPAVTAGLNKVVGAATSKPDYQAGVLRRQGYQPADYSYSAADDHPANVMYKFDPAKNETTYQIPGVKGTDGAPGYATFQGQRKGGGSFSVVPGLSDHEKQQYAEIQDREQRQRHQNQLLDHYSAVANQFFTPPDGMNPQQAVLWKYRSEQIANLMANEDARERAAREGAVKQSQFNQRLDLDKERLDIAKLTAQERQAMSRQWLEFQRWRSEQSDKRRAFKANKRRGTNADLGAVVPPAAAVVADITDVLPDIIDEGVGEDAEREPTQRMAA